MGAHRTLIVLLLVYAASYMDRQLIAILIEPIKGELAISDTAAGLLYGFAFVLFFSVLGIPIARLADRSNRKRIIMASLVLFSAMTSVTAWASTYGQLVLARIGVGIGEAGTGPASQSIIADLYPIQNRATAMAVFAAGLHVGIILAFLVGGIIGQSLGWRAAFLTAGVAGLLMAVMTASVLREPMRTSSNGSSPDAKQLPVAQAWNALWRRASMRHLFAGATVANIAVTALLAWLPAFLMRSHGMSLRATGVLLACVVGLLGGCGTLLGGWLADRLGARDAAWRLRSVVVAFLIAAPCWTVALITRNTVVMLLALSLSGALIAFHVGPSFAMVQTLARHDTRAFAAALLMFIANLLGVGLGPLMVGLLSDAWFGEYGAHSLGTALLIAPPLFIWAAAHYEAAARTLAIELPSGDQTAAAQPLQRSEAESTIARAT